MKTLYFEGAGCSGAEISKATIGNCRIRTAFHLDVDKPHPDCSCHCQHTGRDGKGPLVYLEISGSERTKRSSPELYQWQYTGFVDRCYMITSDIPNDDSNRHSLMRAFHIRKDETVPGYYDRVYKIQAPNWIRRYYTTRTFCYSKEGILNIVNSLGASFEAIEVAPVWGGYQVFSESGNCQGPESYHCGDEFQYDPELTARREAVYQYLSSIEQSKGDIYSDFAMWVVDGDPGALHLVWRFPGTFQTAHNKHWIIRVDTGGTLADWLATATETHLGKYGC